MRALHGCALAALLALAACELTEVTTPGGSDVLVVEAILRPDLIRQSVLLHRTLDGGVVRGERGARVTLRTPEGREVVLRERPLTQCTKSFSAEQTDTLEIAASCYQAGVDEGLVVRPGETYELRVQSARGEAARARTTVPGPFRLRAPRTAAEPESACRLPPLTNLEVVWTPADSAWGYLTALEISGLRAVLAPAGIEAPERLQLTGVSVSRADTTVVIPAEIGLFERFEIEQPLLRALQQGFPAGVSARLVVLAVDRNYVNGVRGGAFNPSGNVRISSVVGDAVGVLGSAAALTVDLVVDARDSALPLCAG